MKRLLATLALTAALLLAPAAVLAADEYEEGGATNAQGGQLFSADGRIEYRVPSDAYWFSEQTRMRLFRPGQSNLPPRPEGAIYVGEPFRLELREWPSLTMLSWRVPATLTVRYDPAELGGRDEAWLRLVRYFDSWVELPMVLDRQEKTITVQVPWGGDYALVAYDSEPATPAPSPAAPVDPRAAVAAARAASGSTISGRIYLDANANGVFDGEDSPLEGAAVRIGAEGFDALASTGADGTYRLEGLPAGTYSVDPILGAQYGFTTPASVGGIALSGRADSGATAGFGLTYKSWYRPM